MYRVALLVRMNVIARGSTISEKIIARAAGRTMVRPGDVVTASVDFAYAHDSSGPRRWRPMLEELGVGLWDESKVAIVTDHYVPAVDAASAAILKTARDFARDYRVGHFHDMVGIVHLVVAEQGLIRPGAFVAGGDSHTPMSGAFGAYAAGYGATDMAAIAATGETWLQVPETIRVRLDGTLGHGVVAKDLMLHLCRTLGMANAFRIVEFSGSVVTAMPMLERMVLCNMAAELGAESGIVAPDAKTYAWLAAHGAPETVCDVTQALGSDADAVYAEDHCIDVGRLAPQVAAPHSPANTRAVTDFDDVAIDQAYIGACVGAKISDLRMAAAVLKDRRVASGVRLMVAPASAETTRAAMAEGSLQILLDAGAILLPSGCGACAGYGAGVLADGEVCISTTNRNFRGRMGSASAEVYLASPYSVAAAAAVGRIADPRPMLAKAA